MIVQKNSFPIKPLKEVKKKKNCVSGELNYEESEHSTKFILWRVR